MLKVLVVILLVVLGQASNANADTALAGQELVYQVMGSTLAVYTCGVIAGMFIKLTNRS